jgi:(p)ppGpp synthase/HD superfamily hydrolase
MHDHFLQFQREKTALKYFLIGRNYHGALKALGFVERYHVGLRKDGLTPELHHQVQIALSVSQQKDLLDEELCLMGALLHDTQEDYQVSSEEIESEFGKNVREVVWKLTKKFAGTIRNKKDLIEAIAGDPHASIIKGVDRNNNLHSMIGVFTTNKMFDYAEEAELVFLPMLKKAGKLFPEQQAAYHAISQQMKHAINSSFEFVKAVRKLHETELQLVKNQDRLDATLTELNTTNNELNAAASSLTKHKEAFRKTLSTAPDNKEAFRKALTALLLTLQYVGQPPRDQIIGIKDLANQLRVDFGISELELKEFSSVVTAPILP